MRPRCSVTGRNRVCVGASRRISSCRVRTSIFEDSLPSARTAWVRVIGASSAKNGVRLITSVENAENRVWTACTKPNIRAFAGTLQNHKKFEPTSQDQQKEGCKWILAEKRFGLVLPWRKATTETRDLPCFRCSASTPERFCRDLSRRTTFLRSAFSLRMCSLQQILVCKLPHMIVLTVTTHVLPEHTECLSPSRSKVYCMQNTGMVIELHSDCELEKTFTRKRGHCIVWTPVRWVDVPWKTEQCHLWASNWSLLSCGPEQN